MEANKTTVHPCTYEDCSTESREFDRQYGYYTEHDPCHVYNIKVETDNNIEEYVFQFNHRIKSADQTLEKLKELSGNNYNIKKYNKDNPDELIIETYYKGVFKRSESQICHLGEWIQHGQTLDLTMPWMGRRTFNYVRGKQHGWEIREKPDGETIECLYVFGTCAGHRVRVNGEITTSNIDPEKLALFE